MHDDTQRNLIEKICWCYYFENLTQEQIAKKFSITRVRVVNLLQEARKLNIVSFTINHKNRNLSELERNIVEKFGIKDCYIVPTPTDKNRLNEIIGKAASNYINQILNASSVLNIGYGATVSHCINTLAATCSNPFTAFSLTGGVNYYLPNIVNDVFKAKLRLHPTPLILSKPEIAKEIKEQNDVIWINNMIKTGTITIFGLGAMDENATVINNGSFSTNDFIYLKRLGAVGDVLGHFIDKNGNIVDKNLDSRIISTDLEDLKALPNTIAAAGGAIKIDIIYAALKAKFLHILVTDEDTAKLLLD